MVIEHPPTGSNTGTGKKNKGQNSSMVLGGLSLGRLLSLAAEQHVDLLLDPVLVVRLIRLRVRSIPETQRKAHPGSAATPPALVS